MYEYKVITFKSTGFFGGKINTEEMQAELNRLGSEGWDLVSSISVNEGYGATNQIVCVLKKKK